MGLKIVSSPTVEPVTVPEVRDHLHIEHTLEDGVLAAYIQAARGHIESSCHIVIAPTTYMLTLDVFPAGAILLPATPVMSVAEVAYDDVGGLETILGPASYVLDNSGAYGWVVPNSGMAWPATINGINAVRVTFLAGYPEISGSSPPESIAPMPIQQAIKLLVGTWWEYRTGVESKQTYETPFTVEMLISPFRQPVLR